jgi:predicted nuclease of predicted toxin-antitoxin system
MRRVLLDQGLSPNAAVFLRSQGWDALHVMDVGLDRSEDLEIMEFAERDARACVTLDHDFHAHLAMAQRGRPSVVFLRIEGHAAVEQAELIQKVWASCQEDIESGAAVSVDLNSIRVRKLPLR